MMMITCDPDRFKVAADVKLCVGWWCVFVCAWYSTLGKIISIETGALRATGRPGWEDLVRKCIYAFFQPQGKEPSHAKKLLQEGEEQTSNVHKPPTPSLPALPWLLEIWHQYYHFDEITCKFVEKWEREIDLKSVGVVTI